MGKFVAEFGEQVVATVIGVAMFVSACNLIAFIN